jgi:hypothetical protein
MAILVDERFKMGDANEATEGRFVCYYFQRFLAERLKFRNQIEPYCAISVCVCCKYVS